MSNGDQLIEKMQDVERKNPYISDLANAGELVVRLRGGLRSSKYPDREAQEYDGQPLKRQYVLLEVEHSAGTETFNVEPDTERMAEAIRRAPKNTWIVAQFEGAKQDAEVRFTDRDGNLIVDSRRLDETPAGPGAPDGPASGPAGGNGGSPRGPHPGGQQQGTAHEIYEQGMMVAAHILSRTMEKLGAVPDEEEQKGLGREYVGYVHVSYFLGMCKELTTSLVIQSDRMGIPLSRLSGDEPGADSVEGGTGARPPEEPERAKDAPVSAATMERLDAVSELVWGELNDEQRAEVNRALEGKVTEGRGRALLRALNDRLAETQADAS